MTEDFARWLVSHHAVLRELRDRVALAVASGTSTLDGLVIDTGRPQRGVLLSLWWLVHTGQIAHVAPDQFVVAGSSR